MKFQFNYNLKKGGGFFFNKNLELFPYLLPSSMGEEEMTSSLCLCFLWQGREMASLCHKSRRANPAPYQLHDTGSGPCSWPGQHTSLPWGRRWTSLVRWEQNSWFPTLVFPPTAIRREDPVPCLSRIVELTSWYLSEWFLGYESPIAWGLAQLLAAGFIG